MLGLFYIVFFGLYGCLSIWLTKRAFCAAKKRGISGFLFGIPVALVMYHLVFWDWVPTMIMHQRTCSSEGGFWIYKNVDEWMAENPGVLEMLVANKGAPSSREGDIQNYIDTYYLNDRFNWVVKRNNEQSLNRWRHEQEVVDVITGETLARYVDFSTSQKSTQTGWSGWKLWLVTKHCDNGAHNQDALRDYRNNFMGNEK